MNATLKTAWPLSRLSLRLPHPLVLLLGAVGVAAALTWIIPAGEYQRRADAATGRAVVVAGTYARVEAAPVGLKAALLAVPRGIIAGADVILTILFVGGAFALLEATGAHALAIPLKHVPGRAAALLMIPIQAALHVPVASVSGQAVLTMPIMAPLADLLGVSRDAAVIAYQTGAGLADLIIPTNGALLAMLLAAEVGYGRWLRFAIPGALLVALVGVIGVMSAA